jgi:uncharacterized protein YxjI
VFDRTKYLVKERVAVLKLTDTYDIYDPETGQLIGIARENPPAWAKYLRLLISKQLMPTRVEVLPSLDAAPVLVISRGWSFLRPTVSVLDNAGNPLGHFKSKLFSLVGGFFVFDVSGKQVAEIKGDWKGWNFRLLAPDGREMGTITKKWAGIGKELFTSADNYIIAVGDEFVKAPGLMALLLAAGLAIDIVLKERN